MYKITFSSQTRHGMYDNESDSIVLSFEQYQKLPELSHTMFDEKCKFSKGLFYEQVRHPIHSFPAVWITNNDWQLPEEPTPYLNRQIQWVFVCLDNDADVWIAFEYYDIADAEDAYMSTVSVSCPQHGKLYRLDAECQEIVKKFYH